MFEQCIYSSLPFLSVYIFSYLGMKLTCIQLFSLNNSQRVLLSQMKKLKLRQDMSPALGHNV